jgi:uncharacterized protein (DUF1499 family)
MGRPSDAEAGLASRPAALYFLGTREAGTAEGSRGKPFEEKAMVDARVASLLRSSWASYGAYLGFGLAIAALILLAAAPLGWRAGWWHYRFAFTWLMTYSAYVAIAAAIVSLFTLALGWPQLDGRGLLVAGLGLVIGAVLTYVPWQYNHTVRTVPRIHDITTDTDNPPNYVAVLPIRAAENANSVTYEGPKLARQQKVAYPDVAPLVVTLPPREAFSRALDTAQAMSGWTIVAADPDAGRIEASQASLWFRFVDDIVIRVAADGSGSRIDMRSVSRQGRSDFGVNASRIRTYMTELKHRVG